MWSNTQPRHANGYKSWAGLSKNDDKVPSFGQNLTFSLSTKLDGLT